MNKHEASKAMSATPLYRNIADTVTDWSEDLRKLTSDAKLSGYISGYQKALGEVTAYVASHGPVAVEFANLLESMLYRPLACPTCHVILTDEERAAGTCGKDAK